MRHISKESDLPKRLRTAIVIGLFVVGSLFFHPVAFLVVFAVIFFLLAKEFSEISSLFRTNNELKGGIKYLYPAISLVPFLLSFWFYLQGEIPYFWPGLLILIGLLGSATSLLDMFGCSFAMLLRLPNVLVSLFYLGIHFACLPLLMHFFPHHYWMLILLLVIWASDSAAYFFGKKYGRKKLYSSLSPNKTVEGLAGGFTAGMLMMFLFFPYLEITPYYAVVLGFVISAGASMGDLVESRYKRMAGLKDSGGRLPGHGGFYDRFDGLVFLLPYILLILIYSFEL